MTSPYELKEQYWKLQILIICGYVILTAGFMIIFTATF